MKPILTMLLVLVTVSHSQAGLTLWSGEPNDVTITGNTATINAAGTFKLQSVTNGNLDVIDLIQIANDVTGTVTIHVRRNPNDMAGDNGATNVGAINLTNNQGDNLIGSLAELRITGDLGTADEIVIRYLNGPLTAAAIVDKMTINRELDGPISVTSMADLDVNLGSGVGVTHSGDITIDGNYADKIDIMAGGYGGKITIAGDLTGESDLVVSGAFDGDLPGSRRLPGAAARDGAYHAGVSARRSQARLVRGNAEA